MEEAVMEHREAVASEAASEAVAVGAIRHTEACDYQLGPWMARERRSGGQQEIARFLQRRLEGLYNKQKAELGDARAKTKLDSVLGFSRFGLRDCARESALRRIEPRSRLRLLRETIFIPAYHPATHNAGL